MVLQSAAAKRLLIFIKCTDHIDNRVARSDIFSTFDLGTSKSHYCKPTLMAEDDVDVSQLNDSQQLVLQTYTSVTDQELSAAIPLLQRSQWNVQVCDKQLHLSQHMRVHIDLFRLP